MIAKYLHLSPEDQQRWSTYYRPGLILSVTCALAAILYVQLVDRGVL